MSKHRNINVELLSICLQMGWHGGKTIPVLLEGVPGTAKTQVVKQIGAQLLPALQAQGLSDVYEVQTFVLPQTMPETIEGIPSPNLERMALERLPLIGIRKLMEAKYGIWFGDEITSATQQTGAATMTLVQDGQAGDEVLPDTVGRVMCCNPPECAAAGRDFTPPEINRVLRLDWKLPHEDFIDFLKGGPGLMSHVRILPANWEEENIAHARTLVSAYLERNLGNINMLDSNQVTTEQASKPWASQRQWWNLTRILAAVFSLGETAASDLAYVAAQGTVSDGIADHFMGFLREMDLPNPEDVIKAAFKVQANSKLNEEQRVKAYAAILPKSVADRPDKLRIALESVAIAAQSKDREDYVERWQVAWEIFGPWLEKKPDNVLSAARILGDRKPQGAAYPSQLRQVLETLRVSGLSHL